LAPAGRSFSGFIVTPPALEEISLSRTDKKYKIPEPILHRRETSRFLIGIGIVSSLFLIVLGSFSILIIKSFSQEGVSIADLKEIVETLIAPVIGVVGAVTGFYFGERQRDAAPPEDDP
jgi:hypothetical protein